MPVLERRKGDASDAQEALVQDIRRKISVKEILVEWTVKLKM
jgi:hypothetical protein